MLQVPNEPFLRKVFGKWQTQPDIFQDRVHWSVRVRQPLHSRQGLTRLSCAGPHTFDRFNGWNVFGPYIEDALPKLDFVSNTVVIVAVADHQAGQRVAALITECRSPAFKAVRVRLRELEEVNAYNLLTLSYVLEAGERMPITTAGKANKRDIVTRFFDRSKIEKGRSGIWDLKAEDEDVKAKLFDWVGI